jgi:GGDEF domain-containing protein
MREHDLVARWGGDEFCVLATECHTPAAERLAERVRAALAEADISSTVGVASRDEHGLTEAVDRGFDHVAAQKRDKGETVGVTRVR